MNVWKKYSYTWITLGIFLVTLIAHWAFAYSAFVDEEQQHGQEPDMKEFLVEVMRDTLENWQSEFLQLAWQVAGLALFFHIGSPQSKEGDDRKEAKLDYIIKKVDSKNGEKIIAQFDRKYPKE